MLSSLALNYRFAKNSDDDDDDDDDDEEEEEEEEEGTKSFFKIAQSQICYSSCQAVFQMRYKFVTSKPLWV